MDPVDAMLHVFLSSGKDIGIEISEPIDVRSLKRRLQETCGWPRFRQQLLRLGVVLNDTATILPDGQAELQLFLLPFCEASEEQQHALVQAAADGRESDLEEILQRPQDPNIYIFNDITFPGSTPLTIAARCGHIQIAQLLGSCLRSGSCM